MVNKATYAECQPAIAVNEQIQLVSGFLVRCSTCRSNSSTRRYLRNSKCPRESKIRQRLILCEDCFKNLDEDDTCDICRKQRKHLCFDGSNRSLSLMAVKLRSPEGGRIENLAAVLTQGQEVETQTTDEGTDLKRIAGSAQLFKEQASSLTRGEISNLSIWLAKVEHDFERMAIMKKRQEREQLLAQARRYEAEIDQRMAKVRRIESYLAPITSTPVTPVPPQTELREAAPPLLTRIGETSDEEAGEREDDQTHERNSFV